MLKYVKFFLINKLKIVSDIIKKLHLPNFFQTFFNDLRHNIIKMQLNPYFNNVYSKMNNYSALNVEHKNNVIWLFWWQGDNKPLIVKRCIDSIKKNSNHKVILITKYNIKKYSTIPDYIYNKMYDGKISLTHFSDILRFNLLRNNGGLWIDSTMLCTSKLSDKYFKSIYTSGGYSNPNNYFVSAQWTSFLIGGYKGNKIFTFMDEFFKYYWKNNDYLLDYFLVDYGLNYVYQHNISSFKNYVDKYGNKNNPHLHDLMKYIDYRYDDNLYNIIIDDTNLFKLTYKKNFNKNKNTFYKKIINKNIP